ncbi:hypothetical protein [Sphingomonas sp. LY160]|uniref:hypothetical protein n=1 Tax=Sphingomonas sp. LY160 TaxID=3095342 RepID=UPI002ADEE792|nr:hypothetical protein [Sphingomonas sp. LY160]MEA1070908.1 hypothetical protein [Sphingomonas sp. LY160]
MSGVVDQYRRMAEEARIYAEAASLPNVRRMHLQSAARLDEIIAGLERVAEAKVRNENAKLT